MGITLGRAKFQTFTSRGTYSNWGLNGRCVEKCAFSNGNISETVRDKA